MRFKPGERARIKRVDPSWTDVFGIRPGDVCTVVAVAQGCDRRYGDYEVDTGKTRGRIRSYTCDDNLQKLLPESDTYAPAGVSVDDLMRGLKERVTA